MNRTARFACWSTGAAVAFTVVTAPALYAQYPTSPPAPAAVKPASLPPFQEAVLANGVRVVLVENHANPVVAFRLVLTAGSIHDPKGKSGLSAMVAQLLTKGAGSRGADEVASAIESAGGSLSAYSEDDFLSLTGGVLSNAAPLAFSLLGDAIARPRFTDQEFELARTQTLSALQLSASDPASLGTRFFTAGLYGAHPYGTSASAASLRAMTRADLVRFHTARLRPTGALLVVAGDMTLPQLKTLANSSFNGWTGAPTAAVAVATPPVRSKTEIVLVHRPGSVQSNVLVGNLALGPADPQRLAAALANRIIGGGADARLFMILREQKSWTYGAYSSLTRVRGIGRFEATAEVRTEVTDSSLVEMLAQLKRITGEPIPTAEFEAAKNSMIGVFPLTIETPQQLAERVAQVKLYGLGTTYLQTYRTNVAALTPSQTLLAAKRVIRPQQSLVVVVGDGTKLFAKLAAIAPTRIISVEGDPMTAADLTPKVTTLALDFTKVTAHRDSFVVMVQGNALGSSVYSLEARNGGWTMRETTSIMNGMIAQQTTVTTDASLGATKIAQSGSMQGQKLNTDIEFSGGRAKGTSMTAAQAGPQTKPIDVEIPAGTITEDALQMVLPLFRWAEGAKFTVSVFSSGKGVVRTITLAVVGSETVTVPAGTFETWKVDQTGGEGTITLNISKDAAKRVVRIAPVGQPIQLLLAK